MILPGFLFYWLLVEQVYKFFLFTTSLLQRKGKNMQICNFKVISQSVNKVKSRLQLNNDYSTGPIIIL